MIAAIPFVVFLALFLGACAGWQRERRLHDRSVGNAVDMIQELDAQVEKLTRERDELLLRERIRRCSYFARNWSEELVTRFLGRVAAPAEAGDSPGRTIDPPQQVAAPARRDRKWWGVK